MFKRIGFAFAALALIGLTGFLGFRLGMRLLPDNGAVDRERIVGVWESVGNAPVTVSYTFTADGKFNSGLGRGLPQVALLEGTYRVEGKNLTLTFRTPDGVMRSKSYTIRELNENVLVFSTEPQGGTVSSFQRVAIAQP